ncbi:MAG TPA: YdcF family protein [Bryobacteraceae bacterium]|nr:YdcF family protein [Bryobacteraceae bacterium]
MWLRRLVRALVFTFTALGILVTLVTVTPFTAWYSRRLSGPFNDSGGPVLVVLGGSTLEPGIIGDDTYWRSVYAVRAYRRWHYPRIILSGAGVAENMRDFLISMGVPAGVIEMEQKSHSTRENALSVARMLGATEGQAVVLMTSDYHMFRASRLFERAGLHIVACPIPHALKLAAYWPTRWSAFLDETSESAKIVYYRARGWI